MSEHHKIRYVEKACIIFALFSLYPNIGEALNKISKYISTHPETLQTQLPYNELQLMEKISNHLSVTRTSHEAALFDGCLQQLRSNVS